MNELVELLQNRRSCKKYLDKNVDDRLIDEIVKAGLKAPSAMNMQSPIFLVIKDKDLRDEIERLNAKIAFGRYDGKPFYNAPVVIVVLYNKDNRNGIYDGSLAIANMLNAAYALGLGACWIHRAKEEFESEEGKEILRGFGITGEYEGVGHVILGYPDPTYQPKEKIIKDNRVFEK